MQSLELKIPPAMLVVIFGLLMWLINQQVGVTWLTGSWQQVVASLISLLALLCVVAGVVSFQRAQTTVDPMHPEKTSAVVTTGIYQYSRNPMYLGFLLLLLAWVFKLGNPITLIMLPLFVWYMNRFQIQPEERILAQQFGEDYTQYQQQVRRWL